jgi:hypothetical protein
MNGCINDAYKGDGTELWVKSIPCGTTPSAAKPEQAAEATLSIFISSTYKETALATLIHQRRLTPSCGGHAPPRGENSGPGKDDRGIRTKSARNGHCEQIKGEFALCQIAHQGDRAQDCWIL